MSLMLKCKHYEANFICSLTPYSKNHFHQHIRDTLQGKNLKYDTKSGVGHDSWTQLHIVTSIQFGTYKSRAMHHPNTPQQRCALSIAVSANPKSKNNLINATQAMKNYTQIFLSHIKSSSSLHSCFNSSLRTTNFIG